MPSPIAHLAAGYVIYEWAKKRAPEADLPSLPRIPSLLLLASGFSLLPDVDSVAGIVFGDFGRYHNNATHSLIVGLGVALAIALYMKWRTNSFKFWFAFVFCCYNLHVVMDSATWSRGVMALWPITSQRFLMPVTLFYGLHWSNGVFDISHLWTVLTESLFAGLLLLLSRYLPRPKASDS